MMQIGNVYLWFIGLGFTGFKNSQLVVIQLFIYLSTVH